MTFSQPEKLLLLENIHPVAHQRLKETGFVLEGEKGSLSEADLTERLKGYQAVGIRSKTQLTQEVLTANPQLQVVGAFCIGTNQIDLEAANRLGLPVFNAPYSNTRSVAEMIIAELVILSRQLGDRNSLAHRGDWDKSAEGAREVRGKTLGIVGYGHIGSQVSVLAEAMGLRVIFYDVVKKLPLGNARGVDSLGELLKQADFVTLHVPETDLTKNMMAAPQLQMMKPGGFLLNASRGTVVDIEALAQSLKLGHLAGAAIDVFPVEPKNNQEKFVSPLQGLSNVFLSPHIGGSTEEAQQAIGLEVAESFIRFFKQGTTAGAVNFPQLDIPALGPGVLRLSNVHRNVPGVMGQINGIVSELDANIRAQYLSTDNHIGYLVMDLEWKVGQGDPLADPRAQALWQKVMAMSQSVKTRLWTGA